VFVSSVRVVPALAGMAARRKMAAMIIFMGAVG
jgi:hypothetical protein